MAVDPGELRDRADERLEELRARTDDALGRLRSRAADAPGGLGGGISAVPGRIRDRTDAFYERVFMPPSYTGDLADAGAAADTAKTADADASVAAGTDFEDVGFAFTEWLEAGRPSGPEKPPAEPRVVTDAVERSATTGSGGREVQADDEGFAFTEWLAEDGEFDPEAYFEMPAPDDDAGDATTGFEWGGGTGAAEEPSVAPPSYHVHPAKLATTALFLAVAVLSVLSIAGYVPTLGPTGGL